MRILSARRAAASLRPAASYATRVAAIFLVVLALAGTARAQIATEVALVSDLNPSVLSDLASFIATVSPVVPGSGTPTGTVTFKNGGTDIGTGSLSGGVVTFSTTTLPAGANIITAVYEGSTDYISSTSPDLEQQVDQRETATTLASGVNPSLVGQAVTFEALVAGYGGGAPSGNVTFTEDGNVLGTVVLEAIGAGASVTVSAFHACALTRNGGVKCWGNNSAGQLGDGNGGTPHALSTTPVDVTGLTSGVKAVRAGGDHTCAILDDGSAKCWGDNLAGALGDGTQIASLVPVAVQGLPDRIKVISTGFKSTCAITEAGAAKCWGLNGRGQLGDGSFDHRTSPVSVTGLDSGITDISIGSSHACAVTAQGAAV